ncbi:PREDICTED: pentatricopeptide repeat-containing protein At4g21880, mitochondrial-like [Erythranthe guttata]|nr:PREDICTED: pentatricopeptide repeat-containing protein At4g21880, mitochondrial-like [Erythranthe guttata]|eukprot:XP_012841723.1 PREDICTED: pentatricopeptide repeat-containing protein At4g21880, mitochondrial-like [Erythranthe guttata]
MPPSTARNLVSLFRSAARLTSQRSVTSAARKKRSSSSSSAAAAVSKKKDFPPSSADADLKQYVSAIKPSAAVNKNAKHLLKTFKAPPPSSSTISNPPKPSLHAICTDGVDSEDDDNSAEQMLTHASSLLYDEMDLPWDDEERGDTKVIGSVLDMPWLEKMTNNSIAEWRKEFSRDRKQKWVFKSTQTNRFGRMVNVCADKLGPDAAVEVFGKLGQETGLKEYNSLISICIKKARGTTDEDVSTEQIYRAYQIFISLREKGFKIEEETYGQFLMYLIDFGMVEEFFFFHEIIKADNSDSLPRLAYYEMLLWIRVNNEVKIQELCLSAVADDAEDKSHFQECILMALCESGRKEEFMIVLRTLDITKFTSVASLEGVFRYLGKLLLEPFTERYLLALKKTDIGADNISNFIYEYAISIPNLAVEDVILKFQTLHSKFEVLPTSAQYEKLVNYCCEFLKVHDALNVVDEAFKFGITLSLETFHLILDACDQSYEFNLVNQINSRISHHNLEPKVETFKKMIILHVKMKDFEGAYELINDLQKKGLKPSTSLFNIILSGYFREKNKYRAMDVLKQMEDADVKPDSVTYSYLIANSHCEKDMIKFYEDMGESGVAPTKQVFMALINAYASLGQFEKAEKVVLDERIPVKNLNEIKSVLVAALASNGQLSGALNIYEEIKKAECGLDPKAIRCLIEHFQSEGEIDRSLQLLEELSDSRYWTDACFRIISHCVRHENLRSAVDLLKQLKDKFNHAEIALEVLFDEVFCIFAEKESTDMQFGLDLLQAVKEEIGVRPSRKSLDFLLSACVYAKDAKTAIVIWEEYENAGLPYNVLSFVRMYQALLAAGDRKSAAKILNKIRQDDPHVRCVIKASEETFIRSASVEKKRKKKKKKKKEFESTVGLLDVVEAKTK